MKNSENILDFLVGKMLQIDGSFDPIKSKEVLKEELNVEIAYSSVKANTVTK